VHWDGAIGLCCTDYDAEMNFGNIKDKTIKEIWLGELMQKIRKLHEQSRWEEVPLCLKCELPYI
jgi:radical SAM protein with 4Fe4S-binding SPASM domain